MTQTAIKAQVEAINKATEIAIKSKGAALKFLTDAGIIQQVPKKKSQSKVKKDKT